MESPIKAILRNPLSAKQECACTHARHIFHYMRKHEYDVLLQDRPLTCCARGTDTDRERISPARRRRGRYSRLSDRASDINCR
jgi:hypothetical protein